MRGREVTHMMQLWKMFRSEEGATAVEYGVLVALIIAVLVVTIGLIGDELLTAFTTVYNELVAA